MSARRQPSVDDPPSGLAPRRLRADAVRNRAAIVAAAQDVFAEQGLEAPLEEIAARAGVGIATLYRRFPTREQLVAAALMHKVSQYGDAAEQALAVPDPWAGFCGFVERICDLQADDRGLADLLSMTLPTSAQIEQLRTVANARIIELVERAKAAGQLRGDFVGEDLLTLLIAHAAVVHITSRDAPDAGPRFIALTLDAFRQHQGAQPLPAAPTTGQMTAAMRHLAVQRGCGPGLERPCGRDC